VRRKKRGGLDVFQFAETVEPEAWGDRAKDLQVRLAVTRVRSSHSTASSSPQDRISALEREQALKAAGTQQSHEDTLSPQLKRPDLSRQYTVVLDEKPPTPSSASP
jgi:hypothetical protein